MARRQRRRSRGLGSTGCRLPTPYDGDPPIEKCGTAKGVTLCVGDRVARKPVAGKTFKAKGTVLGVQMGRDNKGKKQLAARVCYDGDERGELAYSYLFSELKKL
jgi:hypothetical protein